jgi:pilus assembly protein CpaF
LEQRNSFRPEPAAVRETDNEASASCTEDFYSDLIVRRPSLLDERLKLHALIIDEFNLAALEKLPPDELMWAITRGTRV